LLNAGNRDTTVYCMSLLCSTSKFEVDQTSM
jgi:hypothetical protein